MHRLRLEKLLYLELPRSSNFKRRGRSGRKKSGQGTLPGDQKKPEIHFSTPKAKAGLSGQKPIERTQKYVALGVFGYFPKISKCPCAKKYYRYGLLLRGQERDIYVLWAREFSAPSPGPPKPKNFVFFKTAPIKRIFYTTSGSRWRFYFWNRRRNTRYKFITALCNGHSPTDPSVRSGVTVM